MGFDLNETLESLLMNCYNNLRSYQGTLSKDEKQKIESFVFTDKGKVKVFDTPNNIKDYIHLILSLYSPFLVDAGLGRKHWDDFLRTYYTPVGHNTKDDIAAILLDCSKFLIKSRT